MQSRPDELIISEEAGQGLFIPGGEPLAFENVLGKYSLHFHLAPPHPLQSMLFSGHATTPQREIKVRPRTVDLLRTQH
jgi:hypothetical protein